MDKYDVIVIGGGPAGYVCALRCAQLGLRVACVDNQLSSDGRPVLGGTCLNIGCIPSKALLDSSEYYARIRHGMDEHGISVGKVQIDITATMRRKQDIVETLTKGIESLFRKNKVQWLQGHARLLGQMQVAIESSTARGKERSIVKAKHIVIASGSRPAQLPDIPFDGRLIADSTAALSFTEPPKRLGVIGAGVIGLELGSVWRRLGSEVTVLEALDTFLPGADEQLAKELYRQLRSQGIEFHMGALVAGCDATAESVTVHFRENGEAKHLTFDRLLVAVGRSPNTGNLDLEHAGLALDKRGFIEVDEYCRTTIPEIFAIGDVVRGPMLAHKASDEGIAVAEQIAGQQSRVNYDTVPWVVYTDPELAWVGATTQALKKRNIDFNSGSFPFMASGRARAMGQTAGMVKVLSDARTDRVLGVHILGPHASELIAEAVLAMEFDASAEDIARTMHAHPTLSEAIHEAALATAGRALHI